MTTLQYNSKTKQNQIMFPKLYQEIYDLDLTEQNKYQQDLKYLDLQGIKINRPPQVFFNKDIQLKKQKDDYSLFYMKHNRFYYSSVPELPPLYIIRPIKKDPKERQLINKGQFIQNNFNNFEKIFYT